MTPLLGAAASDANMTVFVLDNATVAMTGNQESFTHGERLLEVLRGLGVHEDHLHVMTALSRFHADNVELVKKEIAHPGLSVIVAQRECIHVKRKSSANGEVAGVA